MTFTKCTVFITSHTFCYNLPFIQKFLIYWLKSFCFDWDLSSYFDGIDSFKFTPVALLSLMILPKKIILFSFWCAAKIGILITLYSTNSTKIWKMHYCYYIIKLFQLLWPVNCIIYFSMIISKRLGTFYLKGLYLSQISFETKDHLLHFWSRVLVDNSWKISVFSSLALLYKVSSCTATQIVKYYNIPLVTYSLDQKLATFE